MIRGTKLNTTPLALLELAHHLPDGIRIKHITNYEVRRATPTEFSTLIRMGGSDITRLEFSYDWGQFNHDEDKHIIVYGNIVYVHNFPTSYPSAFSNTNGRDAPLFPQDYYVAMLQITAHFKKLNFSKAQLNNWFEYCYQHIYRDKLFVSNQNAKIRRIERELELERWQGKFVYMDSVMFSKACKKYKVGYKRVGELNELTFKKVKIGNDVEGYINYQFVKLYFSNTFQINRAVYGFNKFIYDTSWGILTNNAFHPHISSSPRICFGNRDSDWTTYKQVHNYNFLVSLLNETVRGYHSGSPYVNVTTLATTLEVLKKKIAEITALASDKSNLNIADYMNYSETLLRTRLATCGHCGGVLGEAMPTVVDDDHPSTCRNLSCKACIDYRGNCDSCGQDLISDGWDSSRWNYRWVCGHAACFSSPLHVSENASVEVEEEDIQISLSAPAPPLRGVDPAGHLLEPICRICDTVLTLSPAGYYCDHAYCRDHDTLFRSQYDTGGLIILNPEGISEDQLYHLRAQHLQEVHGITCADCDDGMLEYNTDERLFICDNDYEHPRLSVGDYANRAGVIFGIFDSDSVRRRARVTRLPRGADLIMDDPEAGIMLIDNSERGSVDDSEEEQTDEIQPVL